MIRVKLQLTHLVSMHCAEYLAAYWQVSRTLHSWFKFKSRLEVSPLEDEAKFSTTLTANTFWFEFVPPGHARTSDHAN